MLSLGNPFSASTLLSLPPPLTRFSTAGLQGINNFAGLRNHSALTAPTNNQPAVWSGHHSFKNDICNCVRGTHLPTFPQPRRSGWPARWPSNHRFADRLLVGCRITDLVGFTSDSPAPTITSTMELWCGTILVATKALQLVK